MKKDPFRTLSAPFNNLQYAADKGNQDLKYLLANEKLGIQARVDIANVMTSSRQNNGNPKKAQTPITFGNDGNAEDYYETHINPRENIYVTNSVEPPKLIEVNHKYYFAPDNIEQFADVEVMKMNEHIYEEYEGITKAINEAKNDLDKCDKIEDYTYLNEAYENLLNIKKGIEAEINHKDVEKKIFRNEMEKINADTLARRQENAYRVNAYRDKLIQLNNGGVFDTVQQPGETEEQYLERLQGYAGQKRATKNEYNDSQNIRNKLAQIIKSSMVLQQVMNLISDNEQIKNNILNHWPLIKSEFELTYSKDARINADQFIEILSKTPNTIRKNLAEIKNNTTKITEINNNINIKTNKRFKSEILHNRYVVNPNQHGAPKFEDTDRIPERQGFIFDSDKWNNDRKTRGLLAGPPDDNYYIPDINTAEAKHEHGEGIRLKRKNPLVGFGKIMLNREQLKLNNNLVAKHPNGKTIIGFPIKRNVSDAFVHTVDSYLDGEQNPKHENEIPEDEHVVLDRLLQLAKVKKGPNKANTVKALKHRLEILEGEIDAGNNSPLIKKEMYSIVHGLKNFGCITQAQATTYMKTIKI